ncbi:MAG: TATA-box-binding family protein [Halobacteriota archaeon]
MKIVNIVAVAKTDTTFNLADLAGRISETEFPPKAPWLKMRIKPENYYVAFYKSGKFLITGFTEIDLIDRLSQRVMRILREAGILVKLKSVDVVNIVLTEKVELNKPLDQLVRFLDDSRASYEPEQFPWLLYKDTDGVSFTVFRSGKMIITGLKSLERGKKSFKRFKALLDML